MNMSNRYVQYYQSGGSLRDIGTIYRSSFHNQKGEGIGDFFVTAYRYLNPLLRSGLSVLGNQAIQSGSNILSDLGKKDLSTIVREQSENAIKNLSNKAIEKIRRSTGSSATQSGSGRKIKRTTMRRRKTIKRRNITPMLHNSMRRGIGRNATRKKRVQVGGRKRKAKTKHTKKRYSKRKRTLDIFN